jgi:putative phage-type endonuclease
MQARSNAGIGASEIAAACGFSRYRSRYGLWLEKTGRAPGFAGNIHTRLGQLCEPRARQLYANATGEDVEIPPCSVFHPEIPWARCTPDGRWVSNPRVKVQIKCVGYFVGRRWRYELPVEVLAQCQWEMFVDDGDRNDLAVLIGSDELEWERFLLGEQVDPQEIFDRATLEVFTIHRNEADIATLLAGAREFMALVESDTQPPTDGSDECTRWLNRKAVKGGATMDYLAAADLVEEWGRLHEQDKATTKALSRVKNLVRERMGAAGASRIETPAGPVLWTACRNGSTQLRSPAGWNAEEET